MQSWASNTKVIAQLGTARHLQQCWSRRHPSPTVLLVTRVGCHAGTHSGSTATTINRTGNGCHNSSLLRLNRGRPPTKAAGSPHASQLGSKKCKHTTPLSRHTLKEKTAPAAPSVKAAAFCCAVLPLSIGQQGEEITLYCLVHIRLMSNSITCISQGQTSTIS